MITVEFKDEYKDLYCVIGKSRRNPLPHIISCMVGIENLILAKQYSKQMAKTKQPFGDQRINAYEWTKPMLLKDAYQETIEQKILIAPTDIHYIETICLA